MGVRQKVLLGLFTLACLGSLVLVFQNQADEYLRKNVVLDEVKVQKTQHLCDHDHYMKNIEIVSFEQEPSPIEATMDHEISLRKSHKAGNWQKIRVLPDYSNLQVKKQPQYIFIKVSAKYQNFIKEKLIPAALGFVEAAYTVYPKNVLSEVQGQSSCGGLKIPAAQRRNGISGYDLVLYVTASDSQGEDWLARAGPCFLDRTTLRPVAGTVEFNTYYFSQVNFDDPNNTEWYNWIQTTIHEMTHVLGFSSSLFQYYINPSNNQKLGIRKVQLTQNNRNWVITPDVLDTARSYFKCPNAFGAPLENDGGDGTAGSHWERTTFGNEAMTGSDFSDSVFSQFTFQLLKSTGWYLPNMNEVQPFDWGKGEGCGIEQAKCATGTDELCRSNQDLCSVDYMGTAHCDNSDPLADGCSYWQEYSNMDCRQHSQMIDQLAKYTGGFVGAGSRCWQTNLAQKVGYQTVYTGCYTSKCSADKQSVKVTVGNNQYTCTSDNQVLNVQFNRYRGTITCPEISRFCLYESNCPKDCSGRGTCRDTTCDCWAGFGGEDCSQKTE